MLWVSAALAAVPVYGENMPAATEEAELEPVVVSANKAEQPSRDLCKIPQNPLNSHQDI